MGSLANLIGGGVTPGGGYKPPANTGSTSVGGGAKPLSGGGTLFKLVNNANAVKQAASSYKPQTTGPLIAKPTTTQQPQQQGMLQKISSGISQGISKVGNFIDSTFFKDPTVVSPVPGQNTTPVNKSPAHLLAQAAKESYPQTADQIKNLIKDPLNAAAKADPKKILNDAIEGLKQPLLQEGQRIQDLFTKGVKSPSDALGKGLNIASGAANVAFSPITTLFSAANDVPVLGAVTKLVTVPFTFYGEGGKKVAEKVVDTLPISQQAKDNIKPGLGEVFALASQLALGEIAKIGPEKQAELVNKFGEKDASTIVSKANELAGSVGKEKKFMSPQEVRSQVMNSDLKDSPAGQELIKASIQADKNGKHLEISPAKEGDVNTLETPQGNKFTYKLADKAESEIMKQLDGVPKNFTPLDKTKFGEIPQGKATVTEGTTGTTPGVKEVGVGRDQLPVGEGQVKVSRLEARMKQTLGDMSQENIDKLGLSTYKEMNKPEQISKAIDYVTKNPQDALKILQGDKPVPEGILKNSLYVAMTKVAEGDMTLATKLASLDATRYGQELSILTELDPHNPVKLLNDVYKIKEEQVKKRSGGKSISEIKKADIKDIKSKVKPPDKYDWNNFVKSIECK